MTTYNLGTAKGKIEVDTSNLSQASKVFNGVGNSFLGIGAIAVAGFGLAIKASAEFEQKLADFKAVADPTIADMDAIRTKALQLGRDSAYGAGEVANAFADLARAGVSAKEIIGGVGDAAVELAAATTVPLQQAADATVNVMRAFNLPASQAVNVVNILSGAVNSSTLSLDDMTTSLKYVGGVATTMGMTLGGTATAISELANAGIKGSTGGTSLRMMLLQLNPTSKKAAEEMLALGLTTKDGGNVFFDAQGKVKDFGQVAQELQDHLKNLSAEQEITALKIMFGNRAAASAAILARDGAKGYAEMQTQLGRTTALDIMNTKLDTLSGRWKIFKSSIETALIAAGTPAQNMLKGLVEQLTKVVNWFAKLSPHTQETILKIVGLTGAVFLAIGVLFKLVSFGMKLVSTFKEIAAAIKYVNAAMEANPWVVLAVVVIALSVALYELYKHNTKFREFVDKIAHALETAGKAVEAFGKKVYEFLKPVIEWMIEHWKLVAIVLATVIFGPIGAVIAIFALFHKQVLGFVNAVWHGIVDAWHAIVEAFHTSVDAVSDFFTALPGRVMNVVNGLISDIVKEFEALPDQIAYAIGFILGSIVRPFIDVGKWLVENVPKILDDVVGFFEKLPGRIWDILMGLFNLEVQGWTDVWNWLKTNVPKLIDDVVHFFEALPGKIIDAVSSLADSLYNWATSTADQAWQGFSSGIQAIWQFMLALPGHVIDAIKDLGGSLWSWMKSIAESGYNGFIGAAMSIWQFFVDLPNNLWNAIKDLAHDVGKWFSDVGSSLWNGFKKAAFGSPKTKVEYALLDMLDTTRGVVKDMNTEMAKLNDLHRQVMPTITASPTPSTNVGLNPVAMQQLQDIMLKVQPGAGAQAAGDHIEIHALPEKSALQIAKEIMMSKRVRVRGA